MSASPDMQIIDAQRRALFAAEVIVNRRLHDFSMRYQCQYSNDVAAERKAIEKEIGRIRRRLPAPPPVDDALAQAVAESAGLDAETARRALLALAGLRPDVLALDATPYEDDEDDED